FGAEAAAKAQTKQDHQAAFEQTLNTLSPEARTAALMQAALNFKQKIDRQFEPVAKDLGGMPPGLANAAQIIQTKMQQMLQQAQQKIAANPPDAQTMQQIQTMLNDLDNAAT